jgi:hypothetical protein
MLGGAPTREGPAGKARKRGDGLGPEIITKLGTAVEVEPAEPLRVLAVKGALKGCRWRLR